MISAEEKQYLNWLGREAWQGRGLVVEIGPWLGGSTYCLAAGMKASGHPGDKKLIVYDNFIWREFMSARSALQHNPGDCFQADFQKNLEEFATIVDAYKRTLPDEVIDHDDEARSKRYLDQEEVLEFEGVPGSQPVEILFVDGAKSWLGLKHLMLHVIDRLVAGQSLLVCQDFKYYGTYWIPLFAMMFRDSLKPLHNVLTATTVTLRLESPILREQLAALPDHVADLPTSEGLELLEQAAEMLDARDDTLGAANVRLAKVLFLSHQNRIADAAVVFRQLQADWPRGQSTAQLERARKYLTESRSVYIPPRLTTRVNRLARRVAGKILKPQRRDR